MAARTGLQLFRMVTNRGMATSAGKLLEKNIPQVPNNYDGKPRWGNWEVGDPLPAVSDLKAMCPVQKIRLFRDPKMDPLEQIAIRKKEWQSVVPSDSKLSFDNLDFLMDLSKSAIPAEIKAAVLTSLEDKRTMSLQSENVLGVAGGKAFFGIPNLWVAGGDQLVHSPVIGATEENSIAAGTDALSWLLTQSGGIKVLRVDRAIMGGQVFIDAPNKRPEEVAAIVHLLSQPTFQNELSEILIQEVPRLKSLTEKHGGGLTGEMTVEALKGTSSGTVMFSIFSDMGQMMGANVANFIAQGAKKVLPSLFEAHGLEGVRAPFAILDNGSSRREVHLMGRLHPDLLVTKTRKDAEQLAQDMATLNGHAHNSDRAVATLKGEMNFALAVMHATGQDDRAVSAGFTHQAATQKLGLGGMSPLTTYRYEPGGWLYVSLKAGMHVSTVGNVRQNPTAVDILTATGIDGEADLRVRTLAGTMGCSIAAHRSVSDTVGNTEHHTSFTWMGRNS